MKSIEQLIILAGGKGNRLKYETSNIPKPLVTLFDEKCILGLLIDKHLPEYTEILILAGYKSEQIEDYVAKYYPNENIRVLCEETLAGTGGAFLLHRDELASKFVVINGDTWFDSDLKISSLDLGLNLAGLVLKNVDNASRYGSVQVKTYGEVTGFSEKNSEGLGGGNLINAGCYVFSKQILSYISSLPCSLERDVFPRLVSKRLLTSWIADGQFLDIGIPETLAFARANPGFFNNEI